MSVYLLDADVALFYFCPGSSLEFLNYLLFDFLFFGFYSQMIS